MAVTDVQKEILENLVESPENKIVRWEWNYFLYKVNEFRLQRLMSSTLNSLKHKNYLVENNEWIFITAEGKEIIWNVTEEKSEGNWGDLKRKKLVIIWEKNGNNFERHFNSEDLEEFLIGKFQNYIKVNDFKISQD